MALNTPISAHRNAPSLHVSVKRSPAKDRNRHAFFSAPSSLPSPPASAPFAALPSVASPSTSTGITSQSTTSEALLKQHASSPAPKVAALEKVVADNNVLSTQNSQLWVLVEKQRAVHNQGLKELERIRKERDSYKAKLVALDALPNGSSDKQLKPTNQRGGSGPDVEVTTSHDPFHHIAHKPGRNHLTLQTDHRPPNGPIKPHRRARFERRAPTSPIFEETEQTG